MVVGCSLVSMLGITRNAAARRRMVRGNAVRPASSLAAVSGRRAAPEELTDLLEG
jgi:hypothetical protein